MINIEEKKDLAVDLFKQGYNCAQSVFLAYADYFNIDLETAKKVSVSFGGGLGRLREVCGAVSGMFMCMGFLYPSTDPENQETKKTNYAAVQRTAAKFKESHKEIICAKLLEIKRQPQDPNPSVRNAEYYQKRPCAFFVARAAEIVGEEINNFHQKKS